MNAVVVVFGVLGGLWAATLTLAATDRWDTPRTRRRAARPPVTLQRLQELLHG